jgi:hypothetical protein
LATGAARSCPAPAIAQGIRQLKMVTDWPEGPGFYPSAVRFAQSVMSPVRVKMRRSHSEHFSTAVPQKTDVVLHRGERQLRASSRHGPGDEARPRPEPLFDLEAKLVDQCAPLAAYSSGVLGIGPPPSEIRRIFTSSELTIWRSSLLRRWTIAGDVPTGASSP